MNSLINEFLNNTFQRSMLFKTPLLPVLLYPPVNSPPSITCPPIPSTIIAESGASEATVRWGGPKVTDKENRIGSLVMFSASTDLHFYFFSVIHLKISILYLIHAISLYFHQTVEQL